MKIFKIFEKNTEQEYKWPCQGSVVGQALAKALLAEHSKTAFEEKHFF